MLYPFIFCADNCVSITKYDHVLPSVGGHKVNKTPFKPRYLYLGLKGVLLTLRICADFYEMDGYLRKCADENEGYKN